MKLAIVAVGSVREKYYKDACAEYSKRMRVLRPVEVFEVEEERITAEGSPALVARALAQEGKRILGCLRQGDEAVALTPQGKPMDSTAFAAALNPAVDASASRLVFIIGSSHGLAPEVYARCKWTLSFGPMTFPHELARVMLLEQIYRGQMILRGSAYHK